MPQGTGLQDAKAARIRISSRSGRRDQRVPIAADRPTLPMSDANHKFVRQESLPSSLAIYHDFIDDVVQRLTAAGWSESELFAIRMALEESISNAIRHGNREDPDKRVDVECHGDARSFWVRVCDEGEGFCPGDVPDCCRPDRLDAPGGRGLALMKAYMTNVHYNQRGNCLTMEKLRTAPAKD